MKKSIIILSAMFVMVFTLPAQTAMTMTNGGVLDTVDDAGVITATLKVSGGFERVILQALATKISGTVAGTMTLQGSVNGTNYVTVDSATVVSGNVLPKVTFVATNVTTQSVVFIVANSPYLYYRISWTGSGTMSAKFSAVILTRKNE